MKRYMSVELRLTFRMKDGETQADAEDRMIEALETLDENFVAGWHNADIEEIEDEPAKAD